jgi:deazaflavin-dependent oxidoreductase (nitroreductase family)
MSAFKRRLASTGAKYVWNPLVRLVAGRFAGAPALLETTGRKSGVRRRTPVGNGLDGDRFWIVAEHGRHSDWVRNIRANPRVRVKVNGRWRSGTGHLMPDDDPLRRQAGMEQLNAWVVRLAGTELMTVRIDLDPEVGSSG